VDNVLNETALWRDAMAAAKIYSSNIRLCINRNNWSSGSRYDMYRHNVNAASPTENNNYDLSDSNFLVYVTSTGCVYKCLFNGRNALATTGTVSTVQPTTTGTAPQQTADGYIWKYLYTITSADADFITANYIPVNIAATSVSSINGIDVITVEGAGAGYTGTPGVVIYGDGTGAAATAVANTSTGKITGISVTNAGSGYTWAKIVLTGGGAQLKHIKQLVEYITGLDCRIGKPIEHVINYADESQLPPALSTGVGLVITGEENVGEDYFERVVSEEMTEEEVATEFENTVEVDFATNDFMSYMNSMGVASEEEEVNHEEAVTPEMQAEKEQEWTNSVSQQEEESVAPVRKTRKPFGESIVGRFKGFFENDEAVN
jgi:hypothetical protein